MSIRIPGALAVGATLSALALGGCASHHVRLAFPMASPGSQYTCTEEGGCEPATGLVPSDLNQSGTAFVKMPEQCAGDFYEIVVLDAGSSEPTAFVTCSPLEGDIDEMGDGAAEAADDGEAGGIGEMTMPEDEEPTPPPAGAPAGEGGN